MNDIKELEATIMGALEDFIFMQINPLSSH